MTWFCLVFLQTPPKNVTLRAMYLFMEDRSSVHISARGRFSRSQNLVVVIKTHKNCRTKNRNDDEIEESADRLEVFDGKKISNFYIGEYQRL